MLSQEHITVKQLNEFARALLEDHIGSIWIKGELSGVKMHGSSGHYYFTLKDEHAQIQCAMFKNSNRNLKFNLEEGLAVLVKATVTIYEQGGRYQLIVSQIEKWGLGALQQAFEALRQKLQLEGLFESSAKKPLPRFPNHIGIITSKSAAALQDILSVLNRRYPLATQHLYHTDVQGKAAGPMIAKAIDMANRANKVDVIILARGGGSLEDLWAFNEEIVARSIFASHIPIVSGIGHEVDFTIADLVADLRAPTPSAAAESVVPDQTEVLQTFEVYLSRLKRDITRQLQHYALKLDGLEKQLVHPGQRLKQATLQCEHLTHRLFEIIKNKITAETNKLGQLGGRLHALSPLATLARGYAIVSNPETGEIYHSINALKPKQIVKTQLGEGEFLSEVKAMCR